jgi:hypothetical protein
MVSEYIFGITRRSDDESQAKTTGGKHLDLHSPKNCKTQKERLVKVLDDGCAPNVAILKRAI